MNFLPNQCLLTDYYQLTMAQAYFEHGRAELKSTFHLFFRKNPFQGSWTLISGIDDALEYVKNFKFDDDSLQYLASIKQHGQPVFRQNFLDFLKKLELKVDIHGMKDGQIAFPFTPVLRVSGPLFLCQLLETPLLNIINFQSLIATKAKRMVLAANNKPVIDFGLRRAQGFDGAISASKAAFVGGVASTSNLWAAKNFGIPASGTMAHSFIMSYERELEAFDDFAHSFPHNCVLLVDTYDAIAGIDKAIKTFVKLKKQGFEPQGLRIDSKDLLGLSIIARKKLDENKLFECKVIASGDLDEYAILDLEQNGAPIDVYGVGTRLITAHDDPALSGVYKLAFVQGRDTFKMDLEKNSWPGEQEVNRIFKKFDLVYDKNVGPTGSFKNLANQEPLHQVLMKDGELQYQSSIFTAQKNAEQAFESLPEALKALSYSPYEVYFDDVLQNKKLELLKRAKEGMK